MTRTRHAAHTLDEVAEFDTEAIGVVRDGIPYRRPLTHPYFRWYCDCGQVSMKIATREQAERDHERHQREERQHEAHC